MTTVQDIARALARLAPPELAADWDNVGLLVGRGDRSVKRVMTCLTLTPESVAEAAEDRADLVVTHHPLPFKGLKRIVDSDPSGGLLLTLIEHGVAVHSSHTAFDSAEVGINQQLATGLGLVNVAPLEPIDDPLVGAGRFGRLPATESLGDFLVRVRTLLRIDRVQYVGALDHRVERVAVACGSAAEFLSLAVEHGCDAFVTGEARFHSCLEAQARGVSLVLPGHYASERFGMEQLAAALAGLFEDVEVWCSRREADPISWS